MLSSGAHAVPPSACLRCQLRILLQRQRHLPLVPGRPWFRPFSAQPSLNNDIVHSGPRDRAEYYYRHINPGSKIIGKKGRKQRQVSEPLSIDSLGQRSEVIVLRDFEEQDRSRPPEDHAAGEEQGLEERKRVSAEDIKAAICLLYTLTLPTKRIV